MAVISIKADTIDDKDTEIEFQTDLTSLNKLIGYLNEFKDKLEYLEEVSNTIKL
jgi:hypothetical protein